MPKVGSVTVGDDEVDVEVDANGRFFATYDEEHYAADTMQELKDRLKKMSRRALDKHAIDVTVVGIVPTEEKSKWGRSEPFEGGIGVVNAKYRGKHERTRELLLISEGPRAEERKKFSLGGGYGGQKEHNVICRRISLDETMEYIRLAKAAEFAHEQLLNWIDARKLDVKEIENLREMGRLMKEGKGE
jgi:hypothetical protein